jgi:cytochrome P450
MPAKQENPSVPAWSEDQLGAPLPSETEAPYFDTTLNAWVLSRHADILAAFRSSRLFPASSDSTKPVQPSAEADHLKMRTETMEALPPSRLNAWRDELLPLAEAQAEGLPADASVDLLEAYAQPVCLELAAMVTGISRGLAQELCETARLVSAVSAEPYDPALRPGAKLAKKELQGYFHSGPESLRDSGFVAMSQTMPCLLANAWYALIQHPGQWRLLYREPGLLDQAVEELLRYAGLVRILSRAATADVNLNGVLIRKGDRIILRIIAGNHDPERFSHPNEIHFTRRDAGHLSLGAGPHACVGANLIRMAAATITGALLRRFATVTQTSAVEWRGGAGFRSPRALWVRLSRGAEQAFAGSI